MQKYVNSAPRTLIKWYKKRRVLKGRDLLERLITRNDMEKVWLTLDEHAKWPDHGARLFREIVFIEQKCRSQPARLRTEERDDFIRIAEQLRMLLTSISNGPLDKLVYNFFPDDAMEINGVAGWDDLDDMARVRSAHAIVAQWPPFIDILETAAGHAVRLADEAMSKPRLVERVPKQYEQYRRLYFVRALDQFIVSEYGRTLHAAVANITNAILDSSLIREDVAKIVNPTKDH